MIRDRDVTAKVFDELAARYATRPGGYTRVLKVRQRVGDAAPMSIVELVDRQAGGARRKGGKAGEGAAKAAEAEGGEEGEGREGAEGREGEAAEGREAGEAGARQGGEGRPQGAAPGGKKTGRAPRAPK